jgi:4-amino-4-deoxy-L-arabinose transferase-like glycosyltransferase
LILAPKKYNIGKDEVWHLLERYYIIDIIFGLFVILYSILLYSHVSMAAVPVPDAAGYLVNAQSWLYNIPIAAAFRPQLISWIIASIWAFTGENWIIIKYIWPLFTPAAGILLYLLIRKYKGSPFALGVSVLTMLNPQIFFWSTQILTENLALFFLVLFVYLIKTEKQVYWLLAGAALGLTFASRYPVFPQALAIFVIECIIRKNIKFATKTIIVAISIIALTVLTIYLKAGSFSVAVEQDTHLTFLLSSYYLTNSINIWGVSFLLVPIAFLFKRTYINKFNYTFIIWFFVALLFWSANAANHQSRFTIQFTPAVYYLALLTIENIAKMNIYQLANVFIIFPKKLSIQT